MAINPRKRGASDSMNYKPISVREPIFPTPELEKLLESVYDRWHEPKGLPGHAERRQDFVFHMTDWLTDLKDLNRLCDDPENLDPAAADRIVTGFLYHAIPHLKAAGRLFVGNIPDGFAEESSAAGTLKSIA